VRPSLILAAARALIATPEKWTRGAFGRTADGTPCSSGDPDAVAFCLSGALISASNEDYQAWQEATVYLKRVIAAELEGRPNWTGLSVIGYSDNSERTHGEVLAALSRACALAIAEGQ